MFPLKFRENLSSTLSHESDPITGVNSMRKILIESKILPSRNYAELEQKISLQLEGNYAQLSFIKIPPELIL